MIGLPAGTRIWIAAGVTDMRSGFPALAAKVQAALEENPLGGDVFIFRGRRGDLVKILLWGIRSQVPVRCLGFSSTIVNLLDLPVVPGRPPQPLASTKDAGWPGITFDRADSEPALRISHVNVI